MENSNFKKGAKLYAKLGVIGVIILLLLIPKAMVSSLIEERQETSSIVTHEVFDQWGKNQTIIGPTISIEKNFRKKKDSTLIVEPKTLYIFPFSINLKGDITTQVLNRSIYEIVTFNAPIEIEGSFLFSDEDMQKIRPFVGGEAKINFMMNDLRGIVSDFIIEIDSSKFELSPNGKMHDWEVLSANIDLSKIEIGKEIPFKISSKIKGSESIYFAPIGKTNKIALKSNCTSPSFNGHFLPNNREVTNEGFTCDWEISYMNRSYPQISQEMPYDLARFGVDLILPVQHYQKTMRCIKYAILFIFLSFATFFLIEVSQKKKIHPIQYTLVGLALIMFYSLLLSFSEHIGFTWAYIIATLMTVGMLTFYTASILKIKKTAYFIGACLLGLYTFIFTLLQMESYALLAGSVGLFLLLGLIMYFSQKIDWDQEGISGKNAE
jgi:inner membrane protein